MRGRKSTLMRSFCVAVTALAGFPGIARPWWFQGAGQDKATRSQFRFGGKSQRWSSCLRANLPGKQIRFCRTSSGPALFMDLKVWVRVVHMHQLRMSAPIHVGASCVSYHAA